MLSISPPRSAAACIAYFRDHLVREAHGDSAQGVWLGAGSQSLGIGGPVLLPDLGALLLGAHPTTRSKLVLNAGDESRRAAWDLTWSAPKSVSVAWGLWEEEAANAIEDAHHQAVADALAWIEETALGVRRGKAGARKEPAGMLVARFSHHTSRALDPQLHSHALLLNLGVCPDGHTGSIETRPVFRRKLAAGAFYREALQQRLQGLGLETEPDGEFFRLTEVPVALERVFSKRRAQIEATLAQWDCSSTYAAQRAALYWRPEKRPFRLDELRTKWQWEATNFEPQAPVVDPEAQVTNFWLG